MKTKEYLFLYDLVKLCNKHRIKLLNPPYAMEDISITEMKDNETITVENVFKHNY